MCSPQFGSFFDSARDKWGTDSSVVIFAYLFALQRDSISKDCSCLKKKEKHVVKKQSDQTESNVAQKLCHGNE